jgi:hypothetical protein
MNYLRDQVSVHKTGIIVKKINTKPKPKKVDFKEEAEKLKITTREYKKRYFEALQKEKKDKSPTAVAPGKKTHRKEVRIEKKIKKQRLKKLREETKLDNYYKMLDEKYSI